MSSTESSSTSSASSSVVVGSVTPSLIPTPSEQTQIDLRREHERQHFSAIVQQRNTPWRGLCPTEIFQGQPTYRSNGSSSSTARSLSFASLPSTAGAAAGNSSAGVESLVSSSSGIPQPDVSGLTSLLSSASQSALASIASLLSSPGLLPLLQALAPTAVLSSSTNTAVVDQKLLDARIADAEYVTKQAQTLATTIGSFIPETLRDLDSKDFQLLKLFRQIQSLAQSFPDVSTRDLVRLLQGTLRGAAMIGTEDMSLFTLLLHIFAAKKPYRNVPAAQQSWLQVLGSTRYRDYRELGCALKVEITLYFWSQIHDRAGSIPVFVDLEKRADFAMSALALTLTPFLAAFFKPQFTPETNQFLLESMHSRFAHLPSLQAAHFPAAMPYGSTSSATSQPNPMDLVEYIIHMDEFDLPRTFDVAEHHRLASVPPLGQSPSCSVSQIPGPLRTIPSSTVAAVSSDHVSAARYPPRRPSYGGGDVAHSEHNAAPVAGDRGRKFLSRAFDRYPRTQPSAHFSSSPSFRYPGLQSFKYGGNGRKIPSQQAPKAAKRTVFKQPTLTPSGLPMFEDDSKPRYWLLMIQTAAAMKWHRLIEALIKSIKQAYPAYSELHSPFKLMDRLLKDKFEESSAKHILNSFRSAYLQEFSHCNKDRVPPPGTLLPPYKPNEHENHPASSSYSSSSAASYPARQSSHVVSAALAASRPSSPSGTFFYPSVTPDSDTLFDDLFDPNRVELSTEVDDSFMLNPLFDIAPIPAIPPSDDYVQRDVTVIEPSIMTEVVVSHLDESKSDFGDGIACPELSALDEYKTTLIVGTPDFQPSLVSSHNTQDASAAFILSSVSGADDTAVSSPELGMFNTSSNKAKQLSEAQPPDAVHPSRDEYADVLTSGKVPEASRLDDDHFAVSFPQLHSSDAILAPPEVVHSDAAHLSNDEHADVTTSGEISIAETSGYDALANYHVVAILTGTGTELKEAVHPSHSRDRDDSQPTNHDRSSSSSHDNDYRARSRSRSHSRYHHHRRSETESPDSSSSDHHDSSESSVRSHSSRSHSMADSITLDDSSNTRHVSKSKKRRLRKERTIARLINKARHNSDVIDNDEPSSSSDSNRSNQDDRVVTFADPIATEFGVALPISTVTTATPPTRLVSVSGDSLTVETTTTTPSSAAVATTTLSDDVIDVSNGNAIEKDDAEMTLLSPHGDDVVSTPEHHDAPFDAIAIPRPFTITATSPPPTPIKEKPVNPTSRKVEIIRVTTSSVPSFSSSVLSSSSSASSSSLSFASPPRRTVISEPVMVSIPSNISASVSSLTSVSEASSDVVEPHHDVSSRLSTFAGARRLFQQSLAPIRQNRSTSAAISSTLAGSARIVTESPSLGEAESGDTSPF